MENEAIMKPPHYSLSVLSSIRKINILTISLEMNPKKMIHAEGGFRMTNIYDIFSGDFGIFWVQEFRSPGNLDYPSPMCWCSPSSPPRQNAANKQGWSLSTREYFVVA